MAVAEDVIAAKHFGLKLLPPANAAHDAVDAKHRLVQIKLTAGNPRPQAARWCGCLSCQQQWGVSEWINANAVATEPIFAEYGIDNPSTGEHGRVCRFPRHTENRQIV
jgi:hypothetical protein